MHAFCAIDTTVVASAMSRVKEERLHNPSVDYKATHPTNRQEDWEYIIGFCDQINKELEGPQIAVRLLVHKIQSPQEWEALQALTVLEACMKNCGRRFHNEIGKYRFLNELIKVVSPKYMGDGVPEKVKTKIIELLYSWTVAFPNEAKINEAYQTLRRQGKIFLLAELLRSKNPEDLQEANRLIKNMVKEDDVRVQKVTKRIHTLEEVGINVKLLSEMLSHYDKDRSSQSDREIIKELYDRCDKLRRAAFKMATETEDNDTSLGDILQASDDLSRVINSYKKIVEGQTVNGDSEDPRSNADPSPANQLSFPIPVLPPPPKRLAGSHASQNNSPSHPAADKAINALSLLDDELLSLGTIFFPLRRGEKEWGQNGWSRVVTCTPVKWNLTTFYVCLNDMTNRAYVSLSVSVLFLPGKVLPVTAYDQDGVRVLLNFASDCPPCRPDVLVLVVSMLNTAPLPVQNVVFQAAVPKSMKVKLQPPSGTELAPFNPILPPASITQVMLLANPHKEKVRLRYKLAFSLGDRQCAEVGEVDQFPPPNRWGHL
uniref:Golgi associated, gamma adaptin ear containing, ARF binding protein 3b n=1 Tax=Esox lucius TaxID=8010 RepID=A0AAY5KKF2_ESOLU